MTGKRVFDIAFLGLKQGEHEFNYRLDHKFFVENGATEILDADANVKLTLEKNTGFIMLKFDVGGWVSVTCDRCSNPFTVNLWDEFKMVVKMVENPEGMNETEEQPDIYYISRTESMLHVKDWVYECAILSIPLQRMCAEKEVGGPQCNKEVLKKLKEMEARAVDHNANKLWKDLERFKDKN